MTHRREKEIVAMLRDGVSCKATARALKVDHKAVYKIRDAYNIPNWFTDPNGPACRYGHPWPENRGREGRGTYYCRGCTRQRKRGNYQPIDTSYVDEIAVELAVAGQPTHLRPAERRAAVRDLLATDLSGSEMAKRIGCTDRTIWRIRKELREAA